jgi:erythromycin esterase-like protein
MIAEAAESYRTSIVQASLGCAAASLTRGLCCSTGRPRHIRQESYERQLQDASIPRFLLDMSQDGRRDWLRKQRLERVHWRIYRPNTEPMSHYADASLPQQFDAFLWSTIALP